MSVYQRPPEAGGGGSSSGGTPIQVAITESTVLTYTAGEYRLLCSAAGSIDLTLPAGAAGLDIEVIDIGSNPVIIKLKPASSDKFNEDVTGDQTLSGTPEAMFLKGKAGGWTASMQMLPITT